MPGIVDRPSPNRAVRPAGAAVDTLIVHYTGMVTGEAAVARLCDPAAAVSAHYVVEETGRILRLVDEGEVAWHAGVSAWRGRTGLNATSIGIEIVNGGHDFGLPPFPDRQIDAVIDLVGDVMARWAIPPHGLVGHADVAPMRKLDPGERFPWARLAAAGLGIWPEPGAGGPAPAPLPTLGRIGYALDDAPQPTSVSAVVAAFQRRFMPQAVDGRLEVATRRRIGEVAAAFAGAGA